MSKNIFHSNEKFLDFKDVLILPKSSKLNSRKDVNLERTFEFSNGLSWTGIPIIAANMTTIGTFDVYNILSKYKIITAFHKFYTLQDFITYNNKNKNNFLDNNYFMVSTGITNTDYENLVNILDNFGCKFILIDVANGYIENFKTFCKKVREKYPYKIIVAGNVTTKEGVKELTDIGIDIIKCGIGGGSACTTRIQTGIGMPQFSCILDCKENIENNKYILSDGGITCPGDLGKAYGAGSDFIMIGGEFSGHDENPGELININGENYKLFYGMSSTYAMKNNYATNNNLNYRSSEGREIKVKYKGELDNTVINYLGGLRSTCTYTNSKNINELHSNCKFIIVNNQYNNNLIK